MKEIIIAGNWKMNTIPVEANKLINDIDNFLNENNFSKLTSIKENKLKFVVCPPNLYLQTLLIVAKQNNSLLNFGAQNCYNEPKGAYTGEISANMLKEIGTKYVILGHSERRTIFNESDESINLKIKSVLENNLIPIFCIGETLEQRQNNQTNEVLKNQLLIGLNGIRKLLIDSNHTQIHDLVIAYEPVWAIGTGLAATTDQVAETHNFIKNEVQSILGLDIPILYGGSLNENNAHELLSLENVNGGLIGGASLKSESFTKIISIAENILNR